MLIYSPALEWREWSNWLHDSHGLQRAKNRASWQKRTTCICQVEHGGGGYEVAMIGDAINLAFPDSKTRRGRVGKEVAQTLDRSCNQGVFIQNGEEYVIRKLTPKECMRLQGVPDEYTDRLIQAGISDSQIYKAAGDGLSVPIAKEIGERIRKTYEENN